MRAPVSGGRLFCRPFKKKSGEEEKTLVKLFSCEGKSVNLHADYYRGCADKAPLNKKKRVLIAVPLVGARRLVNRGERKK